MHRGLHVSFIQSPPEEPTYLSFTIAEKGRGTDMTEARNAVRIKGEVLVKGTDKARQIRRPKLNEGMV